jgi:hypothetical protein
MNVSLIFNAEELQALLICLEEVNLIDAPKMQKALKRKLHRAMYRSDRVYYAASVEAGKFEDAR